VLLRDKFLQRLEAREAALVALLASDFVGDIGDNGDNGSSFPCLEPPRCKFAGAVLGACQKVPELVKFGSEMVTLRPELLVGELLLKEGRFDGDGMS
jgi:hypothetical protein